MNRVREIAARVLDALDAGDESEARAILLGACDEPDAGSHERSHCECHICGQRFVWPGELEYHVVIHHRNEDA